MKENTKLSIGDRMKENYEHRTRIFLPRRTNSIIRIDGKAFHTYTRGLQCPFDVDFMEDMDQTAVWLCEEIQGAKIAYVQSDEISILLTDYDKNETDAWFDGNIQKMASVSASLATAKFNAQRNCRSYEKSIEKALEGKLNDEDVVEIHQLGDTTYPGRRLAMFDSRIFTIPEKEEVINYFIWRQQDATRNSIQSAGQSQFSPKQLHSLSCNEIQEKLFQEKGINWNDYPTGFKRGRAICKTTTIVGETERSKWIVDNEIPIFTQNRNYIGETMSCSGEC